MVTIPQEDERRSSEARMTRTDVAGQRFGHLVAIEELPQRKRRRLWRMKCDCGTMIDLLQEHFTTGNKASCGCAQKHKPRNRASYMPEYILWRGFIARCENPKAPKYPSYGGRGIKVFPAWKESFDLFIAHVGCRPSNAHSLDRINNDGNYEPGNVRWATRKEQMRNTRTNRFVEAGTIRLTIIEASEISGISPNTLTKRLDSGWAPERALTEPPRL